MGFHETSMAEPKSHKISRYSRWWHPSLTRFRCHCLGSHKVRWGSHWGYSMALLWLHCNSWAVQCWAAWCARLLLHKKCCNILLPAPQEKGFFCSSSPGKGSSSTVGLLNLVAALDPAQNQGVLTCLPDLVELNSTGPTAFHLYASSPHLPQTLFAPEHLPPCPLSATRQSGQATMK